MSLGSSFNTSFTTNSPQSGLSSFSTSPNSNSKIIPSTLSEDEISKKIQERLKKLKQRVNGNISPQNADIVKKKKPRFSSPNRIDDSNIYSKTIVAVSPTERAKLMKDDYLVEKLQKREMREYFTQSEKRAKDSLQKFQQLSEYLGGDNDVTNAKQEVLNQLKSWEQRFDDRQFSPRRQREMEMKEKGIYKNVEPRFTSPPKSPKAISTDKECTFSPRVNTNTNEKLKVKSKFKSPRATSPSNLDLKKLLDNELTFKPKINDQSKNTKSKLWDYLEKSKEESINNDKSVEKTQTIETHSPNKNKANGPKKVRVALSPSQTRIKESVSSPKSTKLSKTGAFSPKRDAIQSKKQIGNDKVQSPTTKRTQSAKTLNNEVNSPKSPRRSYSSLSTSKTNSNSQEVKSPLRAMSLQKTKSVTPRTVTTPKRSTPKKSNSKQTEVSSYDHVPISPIVVGASDKESIYENYSPQTLERVERLKQQLEKRSLPKPGGFIDIENEY